MNRAIGDAILSAGTFTELEGVLAGDPRLARSLEEVAVRLDGGHMSTAVLLAAPTPGMTLGAFLLRGDLHLSMAKKVLPHTLLAAFKRVLLEPSPVDAMRALDQADAFDDLVRFVENTELGSRLIFDVLGQLRLRTALRNRLRVKSGRRTLTQFLRVADDQRWGAEDDFFDTLDAFVSWLQDRLSEGASQAPASNVILLRPESLTVGTLEQRMRQTGIPDLGRWTVAMLEGQFDDAFSPHIVGLLRANPRELDVRLTRFVTRLAALRALPAPEVERVTEPALARMQEAALGERARLTDLYPRGLGVSHTVLCPLSPHLEISVFPSPGHMPVQVTARDFWRWAPAPKLECTCGQPVCIHRVAVLDGLGEAWLKDERLAAVLRDALRPAWELVLDTISISIAREQKHGVLSFDVGPAAIDFKFHEIGKRGPSARGKAVTPATALSRVQGLDHRIVERFALADVEHGDPQSRHLGDGLLLLEGHPRVHWAQEPEPSLVVRAEGTVKVEETPTGFRFLFLVEGNELQRSLPYPCTGGAVVLVRAADKRILVTFISEQFLRLVNLVLKVF